MKANIGIFDYMDNDMDPDQSGFELKPENNVLYIQNHQALFSVIMKATGQVYVTLIPLDYLAPTTNIEASKMHM